MITHSLNDTIYFKLSESGKRILGEKATSFHSANPQFDFKYAPDPWRGDWYKSQVHWILSEFGDRHYVGSVLPVFDLTFEEPTEDMK
jgi:hypothetical protein